MKPTDHEKSQLAAQMCSWFKMSKTEALSQAEGFLILAYGWGTPPTGAKLEHKIKKDLSRDFEWVSEESRISFETSEARRIAEQQIFISTKSSTPRFRS